MFGKFGKETGEVKSQKLARRVAELSEEVNSKTLKLKVITAQVGDAMDDLRASAKRLRVALESGSIDELAAAMKQHEDLIVAQKSRVLGEKPDRKLAFNYDDIENTASQTV